MYFTCDNLQECVFCPKLSEKQSDIFQKIFWVSSTESHSLPVAFQGWTNTNFGKKDLPLYAIQKVLLLTKSCEKVSTCFQEKVSSSFLLVKNKTRHLVQPAYNTRDHCTLLLVSNLAEPQWVTVNCFEKLIPNVVCSLLETNKLHNTEKTHATNISVQSKSCFLHEMQAGEKVCISFAWSPVETNIWSSSKHACGSNIPLETIKIITNNLKFALEATNLLNFSFVFSGPNRARNVTVLTFEKDIILDTSSLHMSLWNRIPNNSALVCVSHMKKLFTFTSLRWSSLNGSCVTLGLMKKVGSNEFRSTKFICDYDNRIAWQVADTSETLHCWCDEKLNHTFVHLFFKDKRGFCKSFAPDTHEAPTLGVSKCNNGKQIYLDQKDDLITDCEVSSEDEQIQQAVLLKQVIFPCPDPNQLPCLPGHPKCYFLKDICIYRLDRRGNIDSCRTGSHLQQCDLFECPNHFYKCHNAHCIPWSYLCDNKWDCIQGDDESILPCQVHCVGKLKCKTNNNSVFSCVPLSVLCDGISDCAADDDEVSCTRFEKFGRCPGKCVCLNAAMMCRNSSIPHDHFSDSKMDIFVSYHIVLSNVHLPVRYLLKHNVRFINISNNVISEACLNCDFQTHKTVMMDVSLNNVKSINKQCYCNLTELCQVLLGNNMISAIELHAFLYLPNLSKVSLRHNQLHRIPQNVFQHTPKLSVLHLEGNPLTDIDSKMFHNLKLQTIFTDSFHVCCIKSPAAECNAPIPWFVSCSQPGMFPNLGMKICYIVFSLLIVCCNSWSVATNCKRLQKHYKLSALLRKQDKSAGPYNIIVCSVSFGNLLCGLYLILIWAADAYYKEKFLLNDTRWKRSLTCSLAFFLSLEFSFFLPVSLCYLSIARFMVVRCPFDSQFKSTKTELKSMSFILVVPTTVSIVLTSAFVTFFEISSPLCFPCAELEHDVFTKVITLFLSVLQLFTIISVVTCHILLVFELKKAQSERESPHSISKTMIAQVVILAGSNIFCWVPSSTVFVVSLFSEEYSIEVVSWTVGTILPLNSVVTPIVFIAALLLSDR